MDEGRDRMKYGFTSFSYPQLTFTDLADAASRLGYECVELRVGYGHAHGIESDLTTSARARCADLVAAADVELVCLGLRSSFTDPEMHADEIMAAREVIELAGSLRTPVVRVFGGLVAPGMPASAASELVARAMRELALFAEDQGTRVCIETHDGWTDPAVLANLLDQVDHPAAGVVWDVMHPFFVSHSQLQDTFDLLQPWIRHVHVHDGIRTDDGIVRCPIGTGEVDHQLAIRLLKSNSFQGCVSFEWDGPAPDPWSDWNAPEVHLPRELARLRAFESVAVEAQGGVTGTA